MMKAITLSLVLVGCVGDAPETDSDRSMHLQEEQLDQSQHLVVRVKAPYGVEVAFREPEAGRLLITQMGPNGVPPIELPSDPIEAFQTLVPNHAIPNVLEQAVARTNGAIGEPPALGDAVTIDTTASVKDTYSFPQSAFQCWVKNRTSCEFDKYAVWDNDFYGDYYPAVVPQQYNGVWAAEGDYVSTNIFVFTTINADRTSGPSTSYRWETYDGWWRTFSITGTFGMWVDMYSMTNVAPFHYSAARQQ